MSLNVNVCVNSSSNLLLLAGSAQQSRLISSTQMIKSSSEIWREKLQFENEP